MLLQTSVTSTEVRKEALAALARQHGVQLDLISMAILGKKVNFDKVIKMVDDMVALLKKEQQDDDDKKEMCEMQLDKAEDDLKVLETTVADLEKSIADGKEEIVTHKRDCCSHQALGSAWQCFHVSVSEQVLHLMDVC